MPSAADDCWRLSVECSHWAKESRDDAARLAFRQMATAWADFALSEDFASATHQPADLAGFEGSPPSPAENEVSSHTANEKVVPVSSPDADAGRPEQTARASTNNSSEQRELLPLTPSIPFMLPTHNPVNLTGSESLQAVPAENTASSSAENEEIAFVSDPEVNAERPNQTTRATANNSSGQRGRLSLRSFVPFPKR